MHSHWCPICEEWWDCDEAEDCWRAENAYCGCEMNSIGDDDDEF